MYTDTRGADAYRQVEARSSSPLELVVMLYDAALASLVQARDAAAQGDIRQRGASVSKTLSIVGGLQENLNLSEGGAVASELDRLYDYIIGRLIDVTVRDDTPALTEVHKLLSGLREAWHQIASQRQPAMS